MRTLISAVIPRTRNRAGGDHTKSRRGEAFTLIELLVVVTVVGILFALLFPAVNGALQKGQESKCVGQLRQIGGAMFMYAADHDNTLPQAFTGSGDTTQSYWTYLVAPYLGLKDGAGIGITAMQCPTKSTFTNSMYGANYATVLGINPGQSGSAWLDTGQKRLAGQIDSRAFVVADAYGPIVYPPPLWPLTQDHDGDGVNDSNPIHPYNGLDFRHNHRANFFLLDGSIVSLNSRQWGSNANNVWGK